jgi:type I restriction enzyme M protein
MFESGEEYEWRKNRLVTENTLLSVVTFAPELFYPIGVHTLGIFVKKGIPHPKEQNVLWARAIHDGFIKTKGNRLPSKDEVNDLEILQPTLQAFIHNQSFPIQSIPEFCKATPIDFTDPLLELVPEAYLDSKPVRHEDISKGVEQLVRENAAFIIRFGKEESIK